MIFPYEVETVEDAQKVRSIRNEVKEFMTNDATYISPEAQIAWFDKHRRTGNKLYVYYNTFECAVGYGYIKSDAGKLWGTLAVVPEFQSLGYGTEIYKHLIKVAGELWIEIFANNNSSMIAALKSGFEVQYVNDKIIVLKASIK